MAQILCASHFQIVPFLKTFSVVFGVYTARSHVDQEETRVFFFCLPLCALSGSTSTTVLRRPDRNTRTNAGDADTCADCTNQERHRLLCYNDAL